MCGRFTLATPAEVLGDLIAGLRVTESLEPRYNIAPGQEVAALTNERPDRMTWLRWGLIPAWARDPAIGRRLINARVETLSEKPSFRAAFRQRRCVIPADGFYEWPSRDAGRERRPRLFRLASGQPFGMAGLWELWAGPTGRPVASCVIVTTEANALVATVHPRMPVMLRGDGLRRWLRPGPPDADLQNSLCLPYPTESMAAYEVSARVNSPAVDDARCAEPVTTEARAAEKEGRDED